MKSKKLVGLTAKTIFAEVDLLRQEHRHAEQGYRKKLWSIMGRVARLCDQIDKARDLGPQLALEIRTKLPNSRKKLPNSRKMSLTAGLMSIVAAAKSRSKLKQCWKQAQVIDYLRHKGIAPEKFAAAIKKRGGVERIYRESVSKPRSPDGPTRSSAQPQGAAFTGGARTNNHDVLLPVFIKLADRDAIQEMHIGTSFDLRAVRINQPRGILQVVACKRCDRSDQ